MKETTTLHCPYCAEEFEVSASTGPSEADYSEWTHEGIYSYLAKEFRHNCQDEEVTTLQEAIAEALERAWNGGIKQNIAGYEVQDDKTGEVVFSITTQSIIRNNSEENLKKMDWMLYAEELCENLSIDAEVKGKFTVKSF